MSRAAAPSGDACAVPEAVIISPAASAAEIHIFICAPSYENNFQRRILHSPVLATQSAKARNGEMMTPAALPARTMIIC